MNIAIILRRYFNDQQWSLVGNDYDDLEWSVNNVTSKPTLTELQSLDADLIQELTDTEYKRSREKEYPSIKDQLDMIYHNGVAGWKVEIKKIKDKYPKPI